jgi:DNA-directed RNA polymerase specialized sigma24 family protein
MRKDIPGSRLSLLNTRWSVVRNAGEGPGEAKRSAQEQVLGYYGDAIRRYLLAGVRNPEAADELFQEFAQRFVAGKFRGADPARGRFRDYVKGVLSHLIADHYSRQAREVRSELGRVEELPEPARDAVSDAEFIACCRDEVLTRAWDALKAAENQTGQPFYSALRLRADRPDVRSPELAELLSKQLSKPVTAAALRQTLHRARERFANLVVEEVARSLACPTHAEVEQELIDLQLLTYCHAALERRAW